MGMDWVFDCLPRPVAGVREREARSGSSSDRFLDFMDRCGLPGPGDMEAFLGAGGLFALDAELPMFCQCGVGVKLATPLLPLVCTLINLLTPRLEMAIPAIPSALELSIEAQQSRYIKSMLGN
jgi:hypothetical protein